MKELDTQKLVAPFSRILEMASLLLGCLLAAWIVAWLGWETLSHAAHFNGGFADGPFQLFNLLRRIVDGQIYGRDFQAFTGIGTNWLHLPLYTLFGGGLRASEISRYLTSGLCHAAAAVALTFAFGPAFPTRNRAIVFGLFFFAGGAARYLGVIQPAPSVLGVRTFFPLLLAAALAAPRPTKWIALALAASLMSSIDQAIASLVAMMSVIAVALLLQTTEERRVPFVFGALAGVGLFLVILLAATAGNIVPALRYALVEIPGDQFWYFGVPPNNFLPLNASVLIEDWGFARFAITYLLATVAAFWLLRRQPSLVPTIIFLLVYATLGMISQLGYINSGNLHGSERALFVVILAALLTSTGKRVVPASIVLVGVFLSTTGFKKLNFSSPPREHAFLSAAWQKHLAEVNRNTGDGTIWSVYSGLPEAERRVFHYATDYIIHALGPSSRSRYVNLFLQTKPSLVRLDPPRWRFAAWLLLENWSFYYEVFRAYEPIYVDDLGSLWRPVRTPIPETQTVANDLDSQGCARLAAEPDDVIYSVDVLYEAKNPWRYLPALGQTPRWLLRVTGATNQIFETISVPGGSAYGGQFAFPVIAKGGQMISICPQVSSLLPGVDLKLTNLHVIRLRSSEPVMRYILNIEARPHS